MLMLVPQVRDGDYPLRAAHLPARDRGRQWRRKEYDTDHTSGYTGLHVDQSPALLGSLLLWYDCDPTMIPLVRISLTL
jgi:hypothetical protein